MVEKTMNGGHRLLLLDNGMQVGFVQTEDRQQGKRVFVILGFFRPLAPFSQQP